MLIVISLAILNYGTIQSVIINVSCHKFCALHKQQLFWLFQVTYNIYHTAGIIKQVQLDFTLDDFRNTTTEIYQTHSVRYQEWNTSYADVFSRSGNPGYIIGIYNHFKLFKVQVMCKGSVVNDKTNISVIGVHTFTAPLLSMERQL